MTVQIVKPALGYLPSYLAALQSGWSPDNVRPDRAREEIELIERDASVFLDSLEDTEAKGPPVRMPDGSTRQRLPGYRRWIWDGEFCGSIGFRWQPGTSDLPWYVLGHIGYAVVPWKQGRGYATTALRLLLPEARRQGLPAVEFTTDPDNIPSQRVIISNGGVLLERFTKDAIYGGSDALRFRIAL